MGRKGEEYIFQREQSRLAEIYPALSRLILPIYKMKGPSPGYDVLSFDDSGKPFVIEVKTSAYNTNCFRLTNNELRAATQMTEAGEKYVICYISNWGLPQQDIQEYTFGSLHQTHRMDPLYYMCRPLAQRGPRTVTGLAYFRQKRGFRQGDFAALMGINASKWNVYEGGHHRPPIKVYIRASELLDVTLDELVEEYEVEAANG